MCFVVSCWERADLLALVCGVYLWVCHFPIGILGQVWYLIVSIPDLRTLTYYVIALWLGYTEMLALKSFERLCLHFWLFNIQCQLNNFGL